MHLFYQPNFANYQLLTDEDAFHATKVLRLQAGKIVIVTDGKGGWYECKINQISPKECKLQVINQQILSAKPYKLSIGVAPTKNIERIEWFVEKSTEIGIDEIIFFYSDHSERKQIKLERLQKIAIAAMKQSLQTYLPELIEVGDLSKWLKNINSPYQQKMIAHLPSGGDKIHLFDAAKPHSSYQILIGPEGDFSLSELILAQEVGFSNVVLGNTRLRTETAALTACQIINTLNR